MSIKIAIIGLGYVGLPLARLFATQFPVVGFDINANRVSEINSGFDATLELDSELLQSVLKTTNSDASGLFCTTQQNEIAACNYYIITVPTPVDAHKNPNINALLKASETVGKVLKINDIVIYESTVYPGLTEEECVPILELTSKLKFNVDFFAGYSPERINPGDKLHTVDKILKITSGSSPETSLKVNDLYKTVITAGTHLAPSIKVAEAAKVIENAQRDINIAFVNELAKIFNLLEIDTQAVLEAAGTKWNFLPFKPGLVGGHCIGVDPYYLAQKAQKMGYNPEIILAGRKLNDSMAEYVASQIVKLMLKKDIAIKNASLLLLGVTFKENCPDVRNTKIVDLVKALTEYGIDVTIFDPWANANDVYLEYNLRTVQEVPNATFDVVVLAVAHQEFLDIDLNLLKNKNAIVYDIKGVLKSNVDGKL